MSVWHLKAKTQPQSVAQPEAAEKPSGLAANPHAEPEAPVDSPTSDPAESILRGDPSMTEAGRATAWDQFHSSRDHLQLAQKIQHVEMSNATRHALWLAKKRTAPAVDHVANVRAAIEQVSKLDPDAVAMAEKHPTVLQALVNAVMPSKGNKTKS